MPKVQRSVVLHEKTVQDVRPVPTPPRARKKKAVSGPVQVIQVEPALWAMAMHKARGDARRLKVVSATEVIVFNDRKRVLP